MWQTVGTTPEEPVSDHRESFAEDKHNQDEPDQQNLVAANNRQFHLDAHEEMHFSHQADESASDEKTQC